MDYYFIRSNTKKKEKQKKQIKKQIKVQRLSKHWAKLKNF